MATAFAERERERRELDDSVEILTGGTRPADHVHEEVIDVMREEGFDLSERTPRKIASEELRSCEYVATMGCSTLDVEERIRRLTSATGTFPTLTEKTSTRYVRFETTFTGVWWICSMNSATTHNRTPPRIDRVGRNRLPVRPHPAVDSGTTHNRPWQVTSFRCRNVP